MSKLIGVRICPQGDRFKVIGIYSDVAPEGATSEHRSQGERTTRCTLGHAADKGMARSIARVILNTEVQAGDYLQ